MATDLHDLDEVDPGTRDLRVKAARRAGLRLDDLMLAQSLEGASYALGMAERRRHDHCLHHEAGNMLSFPASQRADAQSHEETERGTA